MLVFSPSSLYEGLVFELKFACCGLAGNVGVEEDEHEAELQPREGDYGSGTVCASIWMCSSKVMNMFDFLSAVEFFHVSLSVAFGPWTI